MSGWGLFVNPTDASLAVLVYANDDASPSDAANIGPGTLQLRSERQGDGNGRVYLIIATASNIDGTGFDLWWLCHMITARRLAEQLSRMQRQLWPIIRSFKLLPPDLRVLQ
jgi:hypothetical protein